MSNSTVHDTTLSFLYTAAQTHRDAHQQQLHRLSSSADAEDRAFYAERAHQRAEADLRQERAEHDLTKKAMQRLLAENIGFQRVVRQLVERWAPQEGKTADEFGAEITSAGEARANDIAADPGNAEKLRRAIEARRDAQRQDAGEFAWLLRR